MAPSQYRRCSNFLTIIEDEVFSTGTGDVKSRRGNTKTRRKKTSSGKRFERGKERRRRRKNGVTRNHEKGGGNFNVYLQSPMKG